MSLQQARKFVADNRPACLLLVRSMALLSSFDKVPNPFKDLRSIPDEHLTNNSLISLLWYMSYTSTYNDETVKQFLKHMCDVRCAHKELLLPRLETIDHYANFDLKRYVFDASDLDIDFEHDDVVSPMKIFHLRDIKPQSGREIPHFSPLMLASVNTPDDICDIYNELFNNSSLFIPQLPSKFLLEYFTNGELSALELAQDSIFINLNSDNFDVRAFVEIYSLIQDAVTKRLEESTIYEEHSGLEQSPDMPQPSPFSDETPSRAVSPKGAHTQGNSMVSVSSNVASQVCPQVQMENSINIRTLNDNFATTAFKFTSNK